MLNDRITKLEQRLDHAARVYKALEERVVKLEALIPSADRFAEEVIKPEPLFTPDPTEIYPL